MTTRYVRAVQNVRLQRQEQQDRAIPLLDSIPAVLVYPVLLLFLIYPYGDYDWGWHYRYGEYFWTHGRILRHDLFSWTMPGYEWVNHSWLYDPLLYVLYNHVSFWGLALASALVGLAVFYIGIRRARLPFLQTAILALCFAWLVQEALLQGLRTQVIGLLLFAVLMDLLLRGREDARWYWALPGLFLVWANAHGSFPLGLAIFGIFLAGDFVLPFFQPVARAPRAFVMPVAFALSAVATLISPFTYHGYQEAVRHFSNPLLTKIVEWRPPELNSLLGLAMAAYTVLLVWGFYTLGRKRFDLPFALVALFTFLLALTARRHEPVFMVVTLPLAAGMLKHLKLRVVGLKASAAVGVLLLAIVGVGVSQKLPEYRLVRQSTFEGYCSWLACPGAVVEFLVQHPPQGRGFNYYDWGGYLIGRGVGTGQLFIDGRMHLWERDGYYRPMADYNLIFYEANEERFDFYNFDWVLIPRDSVLAKRLFAQPAVWTARRADATGVYFVHVR
jgi:hypothetical protein